MGVVQLTVCVYFLLCFRALISASNINKMVEKVANTVHPRLSEPRLSESSIIRTPKIIIFIRF